jgi:transposase
VNAIRFTRRPRRYRRGRHDRRVSSGRRTGHEYSPQAYGHDPRAADRAADGLAGSLLLAVGALGAGAVPLPNPLAGLRPPACDVAESVSTLARRVGADAATPARPIYLALALSTGLGHDDDAVVAGGRTVAGGRGGHSCGLTALSTAAPGRTLPP